MQYQLINVEPLTASIGAVIGGINLADKLSEQVKAEIQHAWLKHLVVFF